jgi:hypothetical protein
MFPQFNIRKELAEHARNKGGTENADFDERAAIIAEGCDISQEEAIERAKREIESPSRLDIIANRIGVWLDALDNLPTPAGADERKLLSTSKTFALSVWAHPALAAGWTNAELFARPGGLVPQMALRNLHLMNIDETGATLMSGKGIVENYERSRFQGGDERPWWRR